jgi:hypothetical protein
MKRDEHLSAASDALAQAELILANANSGACQLYRVAAEHMAAAQDLGMSQRNIADAVTRSVGWVNRILRWHSEGCQGNPFGPQSRAARSRNRRRSAPAERITLNRPSVSPRSRDQLVKMLGMLGSDHDGECSNAARMAEAVRKSVGLTWDDLIIPAQFTHARAA